MPGQWKEVVRLHFRGVKFRDHALDLSALNELSQFQKLVAETAKSLWRIANPDRERLPRHFEQRTRLCLRQIEEGSAIAPLEVFLEEVEKDQTTLWEEEPQEPQEVSEAIEMAYEVFAAIEKDRPLPDRFPRHLVSEYTKWGQTLAADEAVEFTPSNRTEPARLSLEHRHRLETYAEMPYDDAVDIEGEVFEADVRQKRFQLWKGDTDTITVSFNEQQEDVVTTALKDHRSLHLRVAGRGEYLPDGRLLRVVEVESLRIIQSEVPEYDTGSPPIEEVLSSIASEVPEEEWRKLPADLTDNLDHYLYGTPPK
ncbi:MAG: hypothetical protein ABFD90_02040 [Phycisphaerales bacterium]